jgi:indolepyruvate ferredoxin oxidoreductase beta subunit
MKSECTIIINEEELYPPSVNLGDAIYPGNIVESVKEIFKFVKVVNANNIAIKAGDIRMENIALLGVLSLYLQLDIFLWEEVIRKSFPKATEGNLKAFHMGRSA